MTTDTRTHERDERLLKSLLEQVDAASEGTGPHLDEETIALFVAGALPDEQRDAAIQHLSACATCRKTASLVMSIAEPSVPSVSLPFPFSWRKTLPVVMAIAASLLIVTGLVFLVRQDGGVQQLAEQDVYKQARTLLEQEQFADARHILDEAAARGIESGRLASLRSQTVRKITGTIALASLGRLSDFGYEIGGIVARDPTSQPAGRNAQAAHELLKKAEADDLSLLLNRGHALLSLGRTDEAQAEFEAAAARTPAEPLAWLGQGLAHYMRNEFEAAEQSFRKCLELDTHHVVARINLAMTLEEQGRLADAHQMWRQVLRGPLPAPERERIRDYVDELEQNLN